MIKFLIIVSPSSHGAGWAPRRATACISLYHTPSQRYKNRADSNLSALLYKKHKTSHHCITIPILARSGLGPATGDGIHIKFL